jgi:hypothetical protein
MSGIPVPGGAIPTVMKQLAQLNAENRIVVNRDALAMLAAIDGQSSVSQIARIHGEARTNDGLTVLVGMGAVQLAVREADPAPLQASDASVRTNHDAARGTAVCPSEWLPRRPVRTTVHRSLTRLPRGAGGDDDRRSRRLGRQAPQGSRQGRKGASRLDFPHGLWQRSLRAGAALAILMSTGVLVVSWAQSARQEHPDRQPLITETASDLSQAAVGVAGTSIEGCGPDAPCAVAAESSAVDDAEVLPTNLPARFEVAPMAPLAGPPPVSVATVVATRSAGLTVPAVAATPAAAPIPVVAGINPPQTATTAATFRATPSMPDAQPTPGAASRVVLNEHFADNARGWPSDPQSTAWLGDGGYRLFARQPGQFVAVGVPAAPRLRDVTLTGTFRKMGGPPGGGYGLIVRDQADEPRNGVNQVGRYYVLEVGDRGEVGVWLREGSRWVDLLPWTPSQVARPGDLPNELTVRASGDRLVFVVNGTEVASQVDATLAAGTVGVFAGGDGNQVLLQQIVLESSE